MALGAANLRGEWPLVNRLPNPAINSHSHDPAKSMGLAGGMEKTRGTVPNARVGESVLVFTFSGMAVGFRRDSCYLHRDRVPDRLAGILSEWVLFQRTRLRQRLDAKAGFRVVKGRFEGRTVG